MRTESVAYVRARHDDLRNVMFERMEFRLRDAVMGLLIAAAMQPLLTEALTAFWQQEDTCVY